MVLLYTLLFTILNKSLLTSFLAFFLFSVLNSINGFKKFACLNLIIRWIFFKDVIHAVNRISMLIYITYIYFYPSHLILIYLSFHYWHLFHNSIYVYLFGFMKAYSH